MSYLINQKRLTDDSRLDILRQAWEVVILLCNYEREMNMLTPFGKRLRKLRIDQGELMKDMAARLGVTPSYLSAVEMGKKPVPDVWVRTIGTQYGLTDVDELQRLAEYSKPEYRVQIPAGADDLTRETVAVFARKVASMDPDSLNQLLEVMLKRGECE